MPLEPVFGWTKHQVLGPRVFASLDELKQSVERAFQHRIAEAQPRRARYYDAAQLQFRSQGL